MMPPGEASTLIVVEAKFALEIFVSSFDPPALHSDLHQLFLDDGSRKGREEVVCGFGLPVAPLDQEPYLFVGGGLYTLQGKAGRKVVTGAFAPGAVPEGTSGFEGKCKVAEA